MCDIHYNWENTEIVSRAFGNDPDRVAAMSKAYMDGVHAVPGYASVAKHWPGNGQDFRDAHISNNINNFTFEEWMATYGKVYKTLIDGGLDGVMGGHIMMPKYMREFYGTKDEDMMPATLCYELMTDMLRNKLGFNGFVVTDATHMVGFEDRMTRKEAVAATINAGCDMFLFFNDPDEDFGFMLDAYKSGAISEERMTDALRRILGLKAKMGLNKKPKEELTPPTEAMSPCRRPEVYRVCRQSRQRRDHAGQVQGRGRSAHHARKVQKGDDRLRQGRRDRHDPADEVRVWRGRGQESGPL